MAIVVDVSREALSEDCRGGFDSAGNATRVTRLRACCVAARALASGADAVCVFATDASENGRSKTGVGANRALCLATSAREAARALASFERSVGLDGATDDDGRSFCHEKKKRAMALPKGAPLPTSLSLAAMALRRMAAASPPRAADAADDADDADASPRRSVVVLLASDGFERGTSVDENSAWIDAIDASMEKLRVFDADATCHVLCVAPARDEETRAAAVAAMTRCAACARDEKERKEKKTSPSVCVSFPAALTDAHRDTCGSSCASCGASLIQTRNIVWSAAGFGKTHAACGAFRRRVFGDEDESRATTNLGERPSSSSHLDASSSPPSSHETTPPPPSPPRLDGRLACGTEHAHAQEMLSALSSSSDREAEASLERRLRLESETMAVAVETRRVRVTRAAENANETNVTNKTNASNTTLRVERHVARFHAGDVFRTVAALTKPLASVRAGRLLETRAVDAETSRETLRLVPESASRRAAKNARAFDERLELWLRVDGALEIVHVRDPQTSAETLARVGADAADARRRIAAATRELAKRRNEAFDESIDASFGDVRRDLHETTTDAFRGARPILTRPLPNDASGRAFRFVAGTGAGSRASYFWLRDARVEDGANALASFAEKVNDPPTLSDVAGVPPDRLNALALAAPALAQMVHDGSFERASLPSGAGLGLGHGAFSGFPSPGASAALVARVARDVARVAAARARHEATERRQKALRGASKTRGDARLSASGTRGSPARARAALIATRVFGESAALPCGLEPEPARTAAPGIAESRRVSSPAAVTESRGGAARVAKHGLIARTNAASVPMPVGRARVTAANVKALFAAEAEAESDEESDEETRERESGG